MLRSGSILSDLLIVRKSQTFTWNVAFQPSLTETEQVEELMGLKEDIKSKIMIFFLNAVNIRVTRLVLFELLVTHLLLFEHQLKTVR